MMKNKRKTSKGRQTSHQKVLGLLIPSFFLQLFPIYSKIKNKKVKNINKRKKFTPNPGIDNFKQNYFHFSVTSNLFFNQTQKMRKMKNKLIEKVIKHHLFGQKKKKVDILIYSDARCDNSSVGEPKEALTHTSVLGHYPTDPHDLSLRRPLTLPPTRLDHTLSLSSLLSSLLCFGSRSPQNPGSIEE